MSEPWGDNSRPDSGCGFCTVLDDERPDACDGCQHEMSRCPVCGGPASDCPACLEELRCDGL